MGSSKDYSGAKQLLRARLNDTRELCAQVLELSSSGGKSAVIEYLSEKYEATPEYRGNEVLIGSLVVIFDSHGVFQGLNSLPMKTRVATRIEKNLDEGQT